MTGASAVELFEALKGRGKPHDFVCCCPAHEDRNPSMSVTEKDGRVLVHCHAGCPQEAVIAALRDRGVWPELKPNGSTNGHYHSNPTSRRPISRENGRSEVVEIEVVSPEELRLPPTLPVPTTDDHVRHYRREALTSLNVLREHVYRQGGVPVFIKQRLIKGPKFLPYYRVEDGAAELWQSHEPAGFKKLPYVSPGRDPFKSEGAESRSLFWCEGERDVDTLAKQGLDAFTFGAAKNIPAGAELYVKGRKVIIPVDNDDAGRRDAEAKAQRCWGHATSIKVISFPDLPAGGDISDWLVEHTRDELRQKVLQTPDWQPPERTAEEIGVREAPLEGSLEVICLADVSPRQIEWLWPDWIAIGKVSVLAGNGGQGKTTILCDWAARASTGARWPDDAAGSAPGDVIILAAEDDVEDTLAPRLIAAGADRARIFTVRAVHNNDNSRRSFSLQADLARLESLIREKNNVRLVIIDPISSYLGKVDSHKNADVRSVLEPLAEMAARLRVAVVCNNHFSKGAGDANSRIIGSVAFVNQARAAFIVTDDAQDDTRKLLMPSKMNIAPIKYGLAYRIEGLHIDGEIFTSRIMWDSTPVEKTADEVLAAHEEGETGNQKEEAVDFLRVALGRGPVLASDARKEALSAGISTKSLRSAREVLGVKPRKAGMAGGWVWELPGLPKVPSDPEDAHVWKRAPSTSEGIFGEGKRGQPDLPAGSDDDLGDIDGKWR